LDSFEAIATKVIKQNTKKKDLNIVKSNLKNKETLSCNSSQQFPALEISSRQVKMSPKEVQVIKSDTLKQLNRGKNCHPRTIAPIPFFEKNVNSKAVRTFEILKESNVSVEFTKPNSHLEDLTRTEVISTKTKEKKHKCNPMRTLIKYENGIVKKDLKTMRTKIPIKKDSRKFSNNRSKTKDDESGNYKLMQNEFTGESSGFECHLCRKKFSQRGNLLTHVKRIHSEAKNLRYI